MNEHNVYEEEKFKDSRAAEEAVADYPS